MPSERFLNLPAEKRQRILSAAMREISGNPVEALSINRIIREAGISRGSFYQYFEDKNDLLEYIMSDLRQGVEETFIRLMSENGGDPLKAAAGLLHFAVDLGISRGGGAMCRNMFANMRMNSPDPFEMIRRDLMEKSFSWMDARYGFSEMINSQWKMADVFDMVVDLMRAAMARIFSDLSKRDEIEASFCNQLKIIQKSVLKGEEDAKVQR